MLRNHRGSRQYFRKNNFPRKHISNEIAPQAEQLNEADVGITEYISDVKGFSAVLKARYSDFQVNEINLDGEIAVLTNTRIPDEFIKKSKATKSKEEDVPRVTPSEDMPQEIWDQILEMITSTEPKTIELDATTLDKEKRSKLHVLIKGIFKQKIVASTLTKDDKKYLQFRKYNKTEKQDTRGNTWPEGIGEYVHFLIYKENMDTLEATLKLSDCLRMKSSAFTYAGVKDRRAKTTQWFCVRKLEPWKLLKRSRPLRMLHIGNITFKSHPLKLGHLKGNKFRIALRNVIADGDLIDSAMKCLKEKGFINYYGLQRFGNDKEVPTYEIGLQLLLGHFKEACDLILKCKKNDNPYVDTTKAKKIYNETGDAKAASECFTENENRCVESKLMIGLAKSGVNDYVNALENVPRNMRLLYIHAFQALIWNKVVSKRIKEFGLKPIVGDLVIVKNENVDSTEMETRKSESESESETDDETNEVIKENDEKPKQQVKILAEGDLENYSIYDIVLPLPGYDIEYPDNVVKDWYKQFLEEHGLSLDMPKQTVKTYTLSGTYRNIIQKVNELSWKILHYNDPNDNLITSDFERILGRKDPSDCIDGKYKALIIEFTVKSSSYATMIVREILKTDTSSSAHTKLNNYHEEIAPVKSSEQDLPPSCAQTKSLLSDPEKFEEFKRNIFGTSTADDELKKRKHEEETPEVQAKKSKSDPVDETEEVCLKLEPSLV